MNFTRKIDRAMQWAGEKMGAEAKATHTDEFKELESEMDIRHEGMERLLKSMNIYTRWLSRHCDALEDRNRSMPLAHLGRTRNSCYQSVFGSVTYIISPTGRSQEA